MVSRVICFPDLLRGLKVYSEGVFDIVREPIRQGCGIEVGKSLEIDARSSLNMGFDISRFRKLAFAGDRGAYSWASSYYKINSEALDYLSEFIPKDALILSLEMPPWLVDYCFDHDIPFIDITTSPLRFGRDLYIAIRSSNVDLYSRIADYAIPENEVRLEAALLAANVRMQQRRLEDDAGFQFDSVDGALVYIGQTEFDSSLVSPDGCFLRCADFESEIRSLSRKRRVIYKPHPLAFNFAVQERIALEDIVGKPVENINLNAYQLLSSHADFELVGISSGLLQEAKWFDKLAHILYRPFVPIASEVSIEPDKYQQVSFHTLASPEFWHNLLTPEREKPAVPSLPIKAHNHAREVFDLWWDYSKVMTWQRTIPYESFMRAGGAGLQDRLDRLERLMDSILLSKNTGI